MYVCMYVCVYVFMYVCMYVCMYIHTAVTKTSAFMKGGKLHRHHGTEVTNKL